MFCKDDYVTGNPPELILIEFDLKKYSSFLLSLYLCHLLI